MTRRESVFHALAGGRNERIPRAVYGGGRWACRQASLKFEDLVRDPMAFGAALARVYAGLDSDIVFAGSGFNTLPAEAIGGTLNFKDGQAPLLDHPIIERTEDARYFDSIDLQHSPWTLALVEMIGVLREHLPDRFLCATSWGPFTWGMILCDWNRLKDRTVTDPEFIREICDLGVRLSLTFYGLLASRNLIDGIVIPDGAATLVPPELYVELILPAERRLFEWSRNHGLKSFFHQCGTIASQIEHYSQAGSDCISIDASVPIGETYDRYRDRTVTAGNVDVINTILGGSPDSVRRSALDCIASVRDPHRRFLLMPSCDLPPETPVENVEAFLSSADAWNGEAGHER